MNREALVPHLKRHFGDLARLAAPVALSRLGTVTLGIVDVAMTGHYATDAVAALGAAESTLVVTILGIIIGLNVGTLIAVTHALGAGRETDCGAAWHRGLAFGGVLSLIGVIPCFFGEAFLRAAGQPEAVAVLGGKVMMTMGIGLPFNSLVLATAYFLEGVQKPVPATVSTFLANGLNAFFNWIFIFGHLGAPALGATGSGIATTLTRILWAAGLIAYVLASPDFKRFGVRARTSFAPGLWREQRRMGYASSVSLGVEIAAFATLQIFAGWIGTVEIAAYTIINKIFSATYMIAAGVGTATSVLTGHALGRGDKREAAFAGWTGFMLITGIAALLVLILVFMPRPVMALFTDDPSVRALGVPLLLFAGWSLILDSQQTVASGMMRGLGESWAPMAIQTFCFLGILLPSAWWFAFRMRWNGAEGIGLYGLYAACFLGFGFSAALQGLRFHIKTR